MPRHVDIWMDGKALSQAGPFLLQQFTESAPGIEIAFGDRTGRAGQTVASSRRTSLVVAADAVILEHFDLIRRARAADWLAAWADGSVLEISSRPGQRLRVVRSAAPALGETRNPASVLHLEWTAAVVPYWEDITPQIAESAAAAAEGTLSLFNPGTAEAPVCLTVTASEAVSALTVAVGQRTITLSSLALSAGGVLTFGRDELDNLSIKAGSVSCLPLRTASSDDDLFAAPGMTAVSWTADGACSVRAAVSGRWL